MPPQKINPKIRENLATLGFFVFCAICLFGFRIAQGYVLAPEDDFVQNYPAFASAGRLWTPLLLSGFPILADPQVQFFYPLAWVAKHLPLGIDLTVNFSLYIVSAYVLAAYFAALLARRLTGSFYAGLVGGLTYGFSGYFISELKHLQVLHTALWLPLILYLIEVSREQLDGLCAAARATFSLAYRLLPCFWLLFVLSLVSACTIFAGHPQTALYVLVTVLAYGLLIAFATKTECETTVKEGTTATLSTSSSGKPGVVFFCALLLALGAGVLITTVQLLPSLELSGLSARTTFSFVDFVVGQVEPLQVVGFVLPYILGGAYGILGRVPFSEQGPPPGLLFFGFAPIFLALYAVLKEKKQKRIWFFAGLAVLAFTLSLGAHTPLARLFYCLPFFGSFRGLYRILILFVLGVSMLSAFGVARLEKEYCGKAPKQPLELGQMGRSKHFYFCLYIMLSCFSYPFLLGSLPLLFFFIKVGRLPLLYKYDSTMRQKLIVLTTFAALASYAVNAEWVKASPKANEFRPPALAKTYGAETARSHTRILTVKGLEGDREQLPPNLSRLWGVASATGYEPLVSRRYSRLLGISEGGFMQPPWHINGSSRAFDIVSVKYLFAPWGDFSKRAFDQRSSHYWKEVQAAEKTLIFENKRVLPRFYLVPEAHRLAAEDVYQTIVSGKLPEGKAFNPTQVVLIEGQGPGFDLAQTDENTQKPTSNKQAQSKETGENRITDSVLNDERLVFNVVLSKSGYLVLADLFYPGWQATVDNERVEILPANYVQRAVHLGSGQHTVIFDYRPDSLDRGRKITLLALCGWLLLLLCALVLRLTKLKTS